MDMPKGFVKKGQMNIAGVVVATILGVIFVAAVGIPVITQVISGTNWTGVQYATTIQLLLYLVPLLLVLLIIIGIAAFFNQG